MWFLCSFTFSSGQQGLGLSAPQIGEGNGTPLQYSCLENPMDGGAWQAAVHGVTKSGHDGATSLSLFTLTHWRRKWRPTPVFLPGESQGRRSLVGCCLWGRTESDMTETTQQQQQLPKRASPIPGLKVFLYQQAILRYQLCVLQSNSILPLAKDSIRFHRSGAQSCKTVPLLTPPHTHFRHLLCFSQAIYSSEVLRNSSLDSINLLEQLTELRKPVYYQITDPLQRILKDRNQQPDEEI